VLPVRPAVTVVTVVTRAVRLFASYPRVYLGLGVFILAPLVAVMVQPPVRGQPPPPWLPVVSLLYWFNLVVGFGAVVDATVAGLRGGRVRLGASLLTGVRRMLPLIGVAVVMIVLVAAASVLLIVPGVLVALALHLALPIAIAERAGVFGALRRAAQLSKGHRGMLFGVAAVYLLLSLLGPIGAVVVVASAVTLTLKTGIADVGTGPIVIAVMVPHVVTVVLHPLLVAVAYHDLRAEAERADVADVFA
jgi:hypothetical protein